MNRHADAIEVFREPSRRVYAHQETHRRGQRLAPAAFPDLQLLVDDILG